MSADKGIAVVTGDNRGAGLGIAHALGSHGCTVDVTGTTSGQPPSYRDLHGFHPLRQFDRILR